MEVQVTKEQQQLQRDKDNIKAHIASGKDVNAPDAHGYNFLHNAVQHSYELTKFLVEECHADVNYKTTVDTLSKPLVDTTEVQRLLSSCISVLAQNPGETPLHLATFAGGQIKTIEYLLDRGADINAQDHRGITPLHLALLEEAFEDANFLINRGASVYIKDKQGRTPLDYMDRQLGGVLKTLCARTGGVSLTDSNMPVIQS